MRNEREKAVERMDYFTAGPKGRPYCALPRRLNPEISTSPKLFVFTAHEGARS
jgi:hypothetical protein